jgi:hypothetical protein
MMSFNSFKIGFVIIFALVTYGHHSQATTPICSDNDIQKSLQSLRPYLKLKKQTRVHIDKRLPSEIYDIVYALSVDNFGKVLTELRFDSAMIGPSTGENYINFNPELVKIYQKFALNPSKSLEFILAHEFAHQIQGYYFQLIDKSRTTGGYHFNEFENKNEMELYTHSEIDCIALSLLKNANKSVSIENTENTLELIHDDCLEARGKDFCDEFHNIRLQHVKKWFSDVAFH